MSNSRLCMVIPIYNHGHALPETIKRLSVYNLPMILVDDGSDAPTKAVIAEVKHQFTQVIALETLAQNQGKGSAVIQGAKLALTLGYTHMLQIDADGQHDSSDIPKFIEMMNDQPNALISGHSQYDESIPKSRLYGRKITNFWVMIETWSCRIPESMCGFRIYPLQAFVDLVTQQSIGQRMTFDIEILVRMYWQGVPLKFIPTKVIYPEDGHSNFKMWRDNVQISWMHTRLFFGMLWRIPRLMRLKR